MVPSFGSCVNTQDVIAILCETQKKRGGVKMSSGLLNCFDEAIGFYCECVCASVCVRVWIESIGSPGSVLLPAQGGD